jgi:transposase
MEYFVGIDVSLDSASICIVDEQGIVIKEGKCASEPQVIAHFIRHKGRRIEHVGLETGSLSQWLHAGLTREGFRVTVMEARHVRASLATMRVKTDRNDARGIAQLVRLLVQGGSRQDAIVTRDASPPSRSAVPRR